MLYHSFSYASGLSSPGLERLFYDRRERLTKEVFVEIKNPHHVLHGLSPAGIQTSSHLRNSHELHKQLVVVVVLYHTLLIKDTEPNFFFDQGPMM